MDAGERDTTNCTSSAATVSVIRLVLMAVMGKERKKSREPLVLAVAFSCGRGREGGASDLTHGWRAWQKGDDFRDIPAGGVGRKPMLCA